MPAPDTTIAIGGASYPDSAMLSRALVEAGNGYRLAAFFGKCRHGRTVRIGFIGGSITAGVGATRPDLRYASRLCASLGKGFPGTRFEEINAGIGSTGSRFGCSRIQEDVLDDRPDLVVIEYAVNDPAFDSACTARSIEGLVRHCLRDSGLAVILFQTVNRLGDSLNHGIQDRIARHYGIPVVGYRAAIWPLVSGGTLDWGTLSVDQVHPSDFGHFLCATLLYGCLRREYARLERVPDGPDPIPPPLDAGAYADAGMLRERDSTLAIAEDSGWTIGVEGNGRINLLSHRKGDAITLRTKCREVSSVFLRRKDLAAVAEFSLDGRVVDSVANPFPEDWGGGYLAVRRVFEDTGAETVHTLRITNVTGGDFDLRYLLFAH
jgi:hypothetical protein